MRSEPSNAGRPRAATRFGHADTGYVISDGAGAEVFRGDLPHGPVVRAAGAGLHAGAARRVHYGDTVLFVGVGNSSSGEDAAAYVREHDIGYPVGLDASGEVWRRYRVDEPPLVALVSRGGRLVRGWPGGTTELGEQIKQYLVA